MYYGIKCISSNLSENPVFAGIGGWVTTTRGLETWCNTTTFPISDINEAYRQLKDWESSHQYRYMVEEVPSDFVLTAFSKKDKKYTDKKSSDKAKWEAIKLKEEHLAAYEVPLDKTAEVLDPTYNFVKYGNDNSDELKKALKTLSELSKQLNVKPYNEAYTQVDYEPSELDDYFDPDPDKYGEP